MHFYLAYCLSFVCFSAVRYLLLMITTVPYILKLEIVDEHYNDVDHCLCRNAKGECYRCIVTKSDNFTIGKWLADENDSQFQMNPVTSNRFHENFSQRQWFLPQSYYHNQKMFLILCCWKHSCHPFKVKANIVIYNLNYMYGSITCSKMPFQRPWRDSIYPTFKHFTKKLACKMFESVRIKQKV